MTLSQIQSTFSNAAGPAVHAANTANAVNTARAVNTANGADTATAAANTGKAVNPANAVSKNAVSKSDKDTFVKSGKTEVPIQTAPKRLTSAQLKELQEQQVQSFQKMLSGMLTNQADKANIAKNGMKAINADLFSRLTVTPEQQAAAQQAISENGEWGVNAVATRIVDMAVSLSGGDSSKISELREAVEKGFRQAGFQWGEKLPAITGETHKEITKRFDYWEENGSLDGYEYEGAED